MKLSLVIPCYNEEGNILFFYNYVKKTFEKIANYEMIFVNDGSKDDTFEKLKEGKWNELYRAVIRKIKRD